MSSEVKGRIIGVDPGSKRVGIALSDALQITARPAGFADAAGAAEAIARLAAEHGAVEIVVGLPYNMDGSSGSAVRGAEKLAEALKARTGIAVTLWDERLTTAQATRIMIAADVSRAGRKKKIDGLAAQIMLQSFLDARSLKEGREDA